MDWIEVCGNGEMPTDKTIIVEDCNGWIGQAYYYKGRWVLETFGHGGHGEKISLML